MKKTISMILIAAMVMSCAACGKEESTKKKKKKDGGLADKLTTTETETEEPTETPTETTEESDPTTTTTQPANPVPVDNLTCFIMAAGLELDYNNEIRDMIAELTGVTLIESYLTGMTAYEAANSMVAAGDFPDLVYASSDEIELFYDNDVLIAWDPYLNDPAYSNLRDLFTDEEWDLFRSPDGHIYYVDPFASVNGESTSLDYNDEAFWIQVRVLEWAGYPEIKTVDEYFDLLEAYYAENKKNEDGTEIIPYTMICEDWRYYAIETPPLVLQGYFDTGLPIDYSDPDHPKVGDINTNDKTKAYYKLLNEAYKKGLIDPDFAEQDYDKYVGKLGTGSVLGFYDYAWDFRFVVEYSLPDPSYSYVPLALTIDADTEPRYYNSNPTINTGSGLAVTIGCADPDAAFAFLNRILDQDIHDLRFWGVEGVDYLIDDATGEYYRTDEMDMLWSDYSYQASHCCTYSYLPSFGGMSRDGINTMKPKDQPNIFRKSLPDPVVKCFDAYGCNGYTDFLGSAPLPRAPWLQFRYALNNFTSKTQGGQAYIEIGELKHEYLPMLVLTSDFEKLWKEYVEKYNEIDIQAMLNESQKALDEMYS